jgi:hypothetical protein
MRWPSGLADVVEFLGQAEVGDLGRAVVEQQDIGRLEIAVNDALLMGRVHAAGQRFDDGRRLLGRTRGALDFKGLLEGILLVLDTKFGRPGRKLLPQIRTLGTAAELRRLARFIEKADSLDDVRKKVGI